MSSNPDITAPVMTDKKKRDPVEPTLIGYLMSGDDILRELLRDHHHDLATAKIALLTTNKEIKSGGRVRPGKVQKATPLLNFLTRSEKLLEGADFLITVTEVTWNAAERLGRKAILDELLTCIEAKENEEGGMKFSIVGPQVSAFAELVERYGAYTPELKDLQSVMAGGPRTVTT